ncbi:MAG: DUF2306 domain-containing protein, partial [Myxococcota bacterium]
FAVAAAWVLPAFGGYLTESANYVIGGLFVASLGIGFRAIRKRDVASHQAWMTRAFAIGLGVATIRVYIGLATGLFRYPFEPSFGFCFWLGLITNVTFAEWIIRRRLANPRH